MHHKIKFLNYLEFCVNCAWSSFQKFLKNDFLIVSRCIDVKIIHRMQNDVICLNFQKFLYYLEFCECYDYCKYLNTLKFQSWIIFLFVDEIACFWRRLNRVAYVFKTQFSKFRNFIVQITKSHEKNFTKSLSNENLARRSSSESSLKSLNISRKTTTFLSSIAKTLRTFHFEQELLVNEIAKTKFDTLSIDVYSSIHIAQNMKLMNETFRDHILSTFYRERWLMLK